MEAAALLLRSSLWRHHHPVAVRIGSRETICSLIQRPQRQQGFRFRNVHTVVGWIVDRELASVSTSFPYSSVLHSKSRGGSSGESGEARASLTTGNPMESLLSPPTNLRRKNEGKRGERRKKRRASPGAQFCLRHCREELVESRFCSHRAFQS